MSDLVARVKKRVKASPLGKFVPVVKQSAKYPAKYSKSVFVGLASIPSRTESLKQVVADLLPQVAGLGVYLNNWDKVPEFLQHPKIQVARSQDHGDVRDNGKFFFIDKTSAIYYATVDDDIAYPSDYISKLVSYQQTLGGTYAVGVHGSIYPRPVKKLLRQRYLWHFEHEAKALLPVDMLGTGTLLFERAYWQLDYAEIKTPGMADVWFAVAAKSRDFGLWVVPRKENWLKAIEQPVISENLFDEGRLDDSVQVAALTEAEVGSSRRSLIEQVVRVPGVGANFSLQDAEALNLAANKLRLPQLDELDFRLFDYALVIHKRESNRNLDERLSSILEEYVQLLMRKMSGRIYPNDFDYIKSYKALLKSIGPSNLSGFAERDWQYLKKK
jgi:hypothetical protein